jgi:hypothetical protein
LGAASAVIAVPSIGIGLQRSQRSRSWFASLGAANG